MNQNTRSDRLKALGVKETAAAVPKAKARNLLKTLVKSLLIELKAVDEKAWGNMPMEPYHVRPEHLKKMVSVFNTTGRYDLIDSCREAYALLVLSGLWVPF